MTPVLSGQFLRVYVVFGKSLRVYLVFRKILIQTLDVWMLLDKFHCRKCLNITTNNQGEGENTFTFNLSVENLKDFNETLAKVLDPTFLKRCL